MSDDAPAFSKRCGFPLKGGRGPCKRWAGWGTPHLGAGHCRTHGGLSPTGIKSAQREVAARAVIKWGLTSSDIAGQSVDPRDMLTEELVRCRDAVDRAQEEVNKLAELHGPMFHQTGKPTGEHKPHVAWTMLQAQRRHFLEVAREAHRAGIQERRMQLREEENQIYAAALRHTLAAVELGLSLQRQELALQILATKLRELATGTVDTSAVEIDRRRLAA